MRIKRITADTQIQTTTTKIQGILVVPDGSNAPLVELYDEADDSKTATAKIAAVRTIATESKLHMFPQEIFLKNGLYVDITVGGGGTVEVFLMIP